MRLLAPKLQTLRERFGDDRMKLDQEMMALYKAEQVNPAAGCLPVLLQIPVFFALYKVLFVTIEMRHAPFFGWVADLSAPDPTSIFNLFGLLPYSVSFLPPFLQLGVWPILMGISMFLQMRLIQRHRTLFKPRCSNSCPFSLPFCWQHFLQVW